MAWSGLPSTAFERGEVIPGFGLVGNEGDNFLEDFFEFGQVAHFSIFLGNETGFVGSNMRVGQRTVKKFNGPVGLLHLKVDVGEGQEVLKIVRVRPRFIFHVLHLGFDLGAVCGLVFDIPQLFHESLHLIIVRVKFLTGLGDEDRVVHAAILKQKIDVTKDGFRTVGAEGERLFECEIGFADQRLRFRRRFFGDTRPGIAGPNARRKRRRWNCGAWKTPFAPGRRAQI